MYVCVVTCKQAFWSSPLSVVASGNEWVNFKRAAVCQMSPRPFASVHFTSYSSHSQES